MTEIKCVKCGKKFGCLEEAEAGGWWSAPELSPDVPVDGDCDACRNLNEWNDRIRRYDELAQRLPADLVLPEELRVRIAGRCADWSWICQGDAGTSDLREIVLHGHTGLLEDTHRDLAGHYLECCGTWEEPTTEQEKAKWADADEVLAIAGVEEMIGREES